MTLTPLSLHSEPYGSTGNIGENFRRLLGAPTLDPLQTVIREAVQNIADASCPGVGPEILIRLRTLSDAQRDTLRRFILSEIPEEPASSDMITAFLDAYVPVVLEICDFGTVGLGGPTRSDRIPVGVDQTNFIDFLRNIGTARDTEQGGGTYGFGKVALYRASSCSTIIVDTLPFGSGPDGRRLMACHVGRSFEKPENGMRRRFTGRHWWGVRDPADSIADPLTGPAASILADRLGLPERHSDRSGTSIMILGFQPDEEDLAATGNRIIERRRDAHGIRAGTRAASGSDEQTPPSRPKCRSGTAHGRPRRGKRTPRQGRPDRQTDRQCRKWKANQAPDEFHSAGVYQVQVRKPGQM